jgi:hypothetical protein
MLNVKSTGGHMKFLPVIILMFAAVVLFPNVNSAHAADDVTVPTDPITRVDGGVCVAPPVGEEVDKAIDNFTNKYLNFCITDSGFIVTPVMGPTFVTGLRLYTANDTEKRDPASYTLEGSNTGGPPYTTISQGNLSLPAGRNVIKDPKTPISLSLNHETVNFSNNTSYTSYQLIFPTVKDNGATAADAMQIGEVELLGLVDYASVPTLATTTPTTYDCSVTKVEMHNGTSWVTIFTGTAPLDLVAGGTFPGVVGVALPAGTYSQIRVTFTNSFPLEGSRSDGVNDYYTTGTTYGGQTNLCSTATADPASSAEFTFRIEDWGAINTPVAQTFAITPVTIGPSTGYQPTLRFTISDKLELKGTAGKPSTYFFVLSAPTVSIVEP